MERKIGEIFEYNGEWYQCVKQPKEYDDTVCKLCAMKQFGGCELDECSGQYRTDKESVIFKKLEKVGEPFISGGKLYQHCKVFDIDNIDFDGEVSMNVHNYNNKTVTIEIKQNQENMEENKLNLKPFDLEAAKAGKPVCTRDGRKARIICFDRNDLYPIVALIECEDGKEIVGAYSNEGQTEIYEIKGTDLMMLPEKHEGWVNVYKGGLLDVKSYPTKKEAFDKACPNDYVDTIKIEWEE